MSAVVQMLVAGGEPLVSLANSAPTDFGIGVPAQAAFSLTNTGDEQEITIGAGTVSLGAWLNPVISPGNYEVRATLNSGSLSSGTTGSWLGLGTTRSWDCSQGVVGVKTANLTIEIRHAVTLVVKASCSVSITAQMS